MTIFLSLSFLSSEENWISSSHSYEFLQSQTLGPLPAPVQAKRSCNDGRDMSLSFGNHRVVHDKDQIDGHLRRGFVYWI